MFHIGLLTLCLFLFFLILAGVSFYWPRRKSFLLARKLPGPAGLPLIGSAMKLLCKKEDILKNFLEITSPYSSPSKFWVGPKLMIVVTSPVQLQAILQSSKTTVKASFYRFLEPFLGQGLVTASDPLHKKCRKLLQPLFTQRMVDGYSHLFQKHAQKFARDVEKHVDGGEFNIIAYLHGSIFELTMELFLEDTTNNFIDYKDIPGYIKRCYELIFMRFRTFWLHFDFIYQRTSYYKELMAFKQLANTVIEGVINSAITKIVPRLEDGSKISNEARVPSVLEMITEIVLNDPKSLTIEQASDELMTLVAASQDTTSSVIACTCMMLGAHPHIQELVFKEIKEVLGDRKALDFTDVSQLKYLEMCIKETMRLFPIVTAIFRDTVEEFPLGGVTIPRDVTLLLSIYHVHKDPRSWEKPDAFYPEHFLPEKVKQRHPYAYIPFSGGPRKCIAQLFSYTNLKIYIGTILLHYRVESDRKVEDMALTTDITVRPVDGYLVKIRRREC